MFRPQFSFSRGSERQSGEHWWEPQAQWRAVVAAAGDAHQMQVREEKSSSCVGQSGTENKRQEIQVCCGRGM